ncbi:MAG: helix-turn-helix domain-containing protein [Thermoguttaceae bacterium]
MEREHIQKILSAVDGNRAEAAKILGIGETTLYRRLRRAHRKHIS